LLAHGPGMRVGTAQQPHTQAAFLRMLNGTEALPTSVLLRAVDIVLDELQHVPSRESPPFHLSAPAHRVEVDPLDQLRQSSALLLQRRSILRRAASSTGCRSERVLSSVTGGMLPA
jgi:hypothetical protein